MTINRADKNETQGLGYIKAHMVPEQVVPGQDHTVRVDLGLAGATLPPESSLLNLLNKWDFDPTHYSHDALSIIPAEKLLEGLRVSLNPDNVHFASGAYSALDEVIRHLRINGDFKELIRISMSFPNTMQIAERYKVTVNSISSPDLNPKTSLENLLNNVEITPDTIVYIDLPNNPFGTYSLQLTREVIKKTIEGGGIPIIDLAFGEVLGRDFNSIIKLTLDKGGIVVGSLSKTQGLPGLRIGYFILPELSQYSQSRLFYPSSQKLVFRLNPRQAEVINYLYSRENGLSRAEKHALEVANYNIKTNEKLYKLIEDSKLLPIGDPNESPIQVVLSTNPKIKDLRTALLSCGITTESLLHYGPDPIIKDELLATAVRMLTPRPGELENLRERLSLFKQKYN